MGGNFLLHINLRGHEGGQSSFVSNAYGVLTDGGRILQMPYFSAIGRILLM